MKKYVLIILIALMTGLGIGQVSKVATSRGSGKQLIKQKMELLGFQIGNITQVNREYMVPVFSFSSKTGVLTNKGTFKPFTAKVTILNSNGSPMKTPSSNEAKIKSVSSINGTQVKAVNPKSKAVGGGGQVIPKNSSKIKVGLNPAGKIMGVEPSPFVVLNKQQLIDLNFVINPSIQLQGIRFQ